MAGGPIPPISAMPLTAGKVFPHVHVGDGATNSYINGMGVMASVDGDAIWHLVFQLPPSLPTGTLKLQLTALADAVTGDAKVNPKWASVAYGEDPSSATLNAETTQTLTWSTNDDDEFQSLKITLDADTAVAGELISMDLTFETTSWTLAVISTWLATLIWE